MCTDLFRSRRKIICGGVGGWWRSRAAKLHERSLPIHLAVPFLAVLGGVALAGDPAPVIQNGMPTTVVPVFQEPGAPQFSYPAGSTALGSGTGGGTGGTGDTGGGGEGNLTSERDFGPGRTARLHPNGGSRGGDFADSVGCDLYGGEQLSEYRGGGGEFGVG